MDRPAIPLPEGLEGDAAVTVLWRPGCPFCALLLRRLERTGLAFDRVDIWDEPDAAAWVRAHADGNETVPTVRIAGADPGLAVALVNPTATHVLDTVARIAPGSLPAGSGHQAGAPGPLPVLSTLVARARLRLRLGLRGRRGRGRGPGAPR
jgi:glutaredoxin